MFKFGFLLCIGLWTVVKAIETDKMINCYILPWSNAKHSSINFQPEMVNASLCTHVSYGYFGFDERGNFDSSTTNLALVRRLTKLRTSNPKLKLIAVVGGPAQSSKKFSKMVENYFFRWTFIDTCLTFLLSKLLDGLEIHWLYPGSDPSRPSDRENFVTLLKEMNETLKPHNFDFGISVPGNIGNIRAWYDVPEIVKHVDYINVMAYNYTVNAKYPYHSPLYGPPESTVEGSMQYWLDSGAPANKLNLGVALTGHILDNQDGTNIVEYMSLSDICYKFNYGLRPEFDPMRGVSYVAIPDLTISYESIATLEMKLDFVNRLDLKGVMLWTLGHDDYDGMCGEKFPLLELVAVKLAKFIIFFTNQQKHKIVENNSAVICERVVIEFCLTESMSRLLNFLVPTIFGNVLLLIVYATLTTAEEGAKMINCYVGPWVNDNRKPKEAFRPEMINASACTHISYAFFGFDKQGNLDSSTTNLDKMINCVFDDTTGNRHFQPEMINASLCTHITYGFFGFNEDLYSTSIKSDFMDRIRRLQSLKPQIKLLAAIGGPQENFAKYWTIIKSNMARRNFISNVMQLVKSKYFDGIVLHLLLPGNDVELEDRIHYAALVEDMGYNLRNSKYGHFEFGISVSGNISYSRQWYDIPEIVKYVDFINVFAYNYTINLPHQKYAPLYDYEDYSVQNTIDYWLVNGAPATKLLLSIAFVARISTNSTVSYVPYSDMCPYENLVKSINGLEFDEKTATSTTYYDDKVIDYESIYSLSKKLDFANEIGLKGVTIWSLDTDDYLGICGRKYPLLKLVARKFDKRYVCLPGECCHANNVMNCVKDDEDE
ncbi:putative chitinase 10 [Haematobia irritans]|uniref:putative chitinase 10 n=1 Tax=Haematobia irritans TaxID=7368 RepID=UPI003F4F9F50